MDCGYHLDRVEPALAARDTPGLWSGGVQGRRLKAGCRCQSLTVRSPSPPALTPAGPGTLGPQHLRMHRNAANLLRAGWPWRLPARAPTDPDVRALTHPVLQPTGLPSQEGSPRLSERVSWTGFGASMCSTCFPRLGLPADASLPSTGSSGASSPASTVVSKRYDFLPPVPPHFVVFAWRYLSVHSFDSLPDGRVHRRVLELVTRCLQPGLALRRRQDLPGSRETPIVRLPCSVDAGRTARTRPMQCRSVAPGM
jgi:hypothetical protein